MHQQENCNSICFDARLFKSPHSAKPFNVLDDEDPGTRLLVNGTESVFHYLWNLKQALSLDHRSVIPGHYDRIQVAKREVDHLDSLITDIIRDARKSIAKAEDLWAHRMMNEDESDSIGHQRKTVIIDNLPGRPHLWLVESIRSPPTEEDSNAISRKRKATTIPYDSGIVKKSKYENGDIINVVDDD